MMSVSEFMFLYEGHLKDEDRPTCRAAYNRTENDYKALFECRRYVNYGTFRAAYSRFCRKRRFATAKSVAMLFKVPPSKLLV